MAQPNPYAKATDFTEYQTEHEAAPFNGALLDAELVDIETNLDDLNANIALLQRDDGALKNLIVTTASLSSDTLALIASDTFSVEGTWATSTVYAVGDLVEKDGSVYLCFVAHTSGTFATDLAAAKWGDMTGAISTSPTFTNVTATGTVTTVTLAVTGNATVDGNTTIGSASNDTLTVNAGTWTIGSNYTATRALGASAGTIDARTDSTTVSASNTNLDVNGRSAYVNFSGATNALAIKAHANSLIISGSGSITLGYSYISSFTLSSSGGVTTAASYVAAAPTLSSTGVIDSHYGFLAGDLGHATKVNYAYAFAASDITASATIAVAFKGGVSAGTGKYNLYMDGTAVNYLAGALGINNTSLTGYSLRVSKSVTGALASVGIESSGITQSDVTTSVAQFQSNLITAAAAFTVVSGYHFHAIQGTIGAGSAVTNQYGFIVSSTLTGATNNYGFHGNIASGSNRWNLYMAGTAANYFAGDLTIYGATAIPAGGTAGSGYKLSNTSNFGIFFGSGVPTLAAAQGSIYMRSDGSSTSTRAYINTDGGTTWTAVTTAA